jgi:hypothetical protein
VRNQGKLACNTIIIFSSLFTLYLAQEIHIIHKVQNPQHETKSNSKYIVNQEANSLKECIFKAYYYVPNSRAKINSKLHKVLQEKVSQKYKKVAHNFEVNFSMSLHFTSKHQVSTIISQRFTQVLENFTTSRLIELTKTTKYFPHIF